MPPFQELAVKKQYRTIEFELLYIPIKCNKQSKSPSVMIIIECNTHEFLYFNKIKYFLFSYSNLHFICVPKFWYHLITNKLKWWHFSQIPDNYIWPKLVPYTISYFDTIPVLHSCAHNCVMHKNWGDVTSLYPRHIIEIMELPCLYFTNPSPFH